MTDTTRTSGVSATIVETRSVVGSWATVVGIAATIREMLVRPEMSALWATTNSVAESPRTDTRAASTSALSSSAARKRAAWYSGDNPLTSVDEYSGAF